MSTIERYPWPADAYRSAPTATRAALRETVAEALHCPIGRVHLFDRGNGFRLLVLAFHPVAPGVRRGADATIRARMPVGLVMLLRTLPRDVEAAVLAVAELGGAEAVDVWLRAWRRR